MLALRNYQTDLIEKARGLMRDGCRSLIIESPTGSGKTLLTAFMLKAAAEKGFNSFFTVHRRELVRQSMKTFSAVGLRYGVCASGFMEEPNFPVQIASIQTLARRHRRLKKPRLIVWDECQHQAAKSWAAVHAAFPDAYHVGLSATPERLDGKGLGAYFARIIHGPSVADLITQGYLSPFKIFAPATVDTSQMHVQMGDFNRAEVIAAVDKPTIVGQAVQHYQKYANGKRALVRGVSIEHSKRIAAQFLQAGIAAKHVDGETPMEERDEAMRSFVEGKTLVLTFVDLFAEGVDVPGIEAVIDLRPTQSLTLWLQFCGRALRPAPGKECAIICDAAGNAARHGFPDDEREWSLAGREVKKRGSDESDVSVKIRVCKKCFAAMAGFVKVCKWCGYVFEILPREVKQVPGELIEIDRGILSRHKKQENWHAKSREELLKIARDRKYKNPHGWVFHIMQARQVKKLKGVAA